jgi:hypothetical protein
MVICESSQGIVVYRMSDLMFLSEKAKSTDSFVDDVGQRAPTKKADLELAPAFAYMD